ncbi:hypothetical protein RJ639_019571 [Escallonia herrerae]|uniref:Alpha/beta hydrolase fold-3 domain-containing protein n=1 Tax=Escallonia herrerae TaxID=1293975 RepID=A0AA88VC93_9ASTE|nr:hypothetical protein RJ639_019571 [Escallonia herrerae]
MDSGEEYVAVVHDFQSYVRVYSDGRVEREMDYVIDYETGFRKRDFQPASIDDDVWLPSKDVKISSETDVSVRLFKPKNIAPGEKIPIVIYFHGGFFVSQSAFGALYHYFLDSLVTEANVIAVSVEYRRAPEQFLPVAYDDSWEAVKWVASHCARNGPEEWLNEYGDFECAYFAGNEAGCSRVLVWVAELGNFKVWGYNYKDVLSKSGWEGKVEIRETKDTGTMFFLVDTVPRGDDTMVMLRKVASFVNQKWEDPEEE